jgi:ribosomal protein S18 acetylase RimI-like enzyme
MIKIAKLPRSRWDAFKDLRLEALKNDPSAFGSSFEEETGFADDVWRERIRNVLFALSDGKPVGMLSYVFSDRLKTRHIVNIYGVYVTPGRRGMGIGRMLVERALAEIRKNRRIIKVRLSVNASLAPAVGLYKKAGFEEVGRASKELKVGGKFYDMLLMEMEIRRALD